MKASSSLSFGGFHETRCDRRSWIVRCSLPNERSFPTFEDVCVLWLERGKSNTFAKGWMLNSPKRARMHMLENFDPPWGRKLQHNAAFSSRSYNKAWPNLNASSTLTLESNAAWKSPLTRHSHLPSWCLFGNTFCRQTVNLETCLKNKYTNVSKISWTIPYDPTLRSEQLFRIGKSGLLWNPYVRLRETKYHFFFFWKTNNTNDKLNYLINEFFVFSIITPSTWQILIFTLIKRSLIADKIKCNNFKAATGLVNTRRSFTKWIFSLESRRGKKSERKKGAKSERQKILRAVYVLSSRWPSKRGWTQTRTTNTFSRHTSRGLYDYGTNLVLMTGSERRSSSLGE